MRYTTDLITALFKLSQLIALEGATIYSLCMRWMLIFAITLLCPLTALAFPAIVASVHDGDTISIIANGRYEKVRLAGIDAPELQVHGKWPDQPFGWEAHTVLANLILGQTVDVEPTGQTSYGRIVATVTYQDTDMGLLMVERGMGWVDTCYDRDPSILDMERRAQAAKLGLWAKPAIAPWKWRAAFERRTDNRTCH